MNQKKKLLISFSGGKTSAYMVWWLLNKWEDRHNWEVIIIFANTGKEAEGTLLFVDECAQEWGINIIWVEGYPSEKGKGWGVVPKVVSYETASRKGEPYEAFIKRLGIPSSNAPWCSDQLKRKTINAYLKTIGWKGFYKAIGIRSDETHRVSKKAAKNRIIYPLVDFNPKTKQEITEWWATQSFNLDIHPDEGNCDNCWKKNTNLLCRNALRNPDSFDWWQDMTSLYGHNNPRNAPLKTPFNFYRGNRSPKDIFELAKSPERIKKLAEKEKRSGCNESCEAW